MESLDGQILEVHGCRVLFVQIVDRTVKCGRKKLVKCEPFVHLFACRDVVLLVEVELNVHVNVEQLPQVDFVPGGCLEHFIQLDSQVNVGQQVVFPVVQIAELDPPVDKGQGDVLVLLFVCVESLHVVELPGPVHHFAIRAPEADDCVMNEEQ